MAYPYYPGASYAPYPTAFSQPVAQPAQNPAQGLSPSSRAVSSKEEAMGVAADFSGNAMVFPDVAHNRVYVKRWNFQTGVADFFEFVPFVPEQAPAVQYATMDDLNKLREEIMNSRKAAKKNDE